MRRVSSNHKRMKNLISCEEEAGNNMDLLDKEGDGEVMKDYQG